MLHIHDLYTAMNILCMMSKIVSLKNNAMVDTSAMTSMTGQEDLSHWVIACSSLAIATSMTMATSSDIMRTVMQCNSNSICCTCSQLLLCSEWWY